MSPLALVTCKSLPEPDPDEAPLLAACHEAGLNVSLAAWDDPTVDWSRYSCAVFHSCWNYYEDPVAFRAWICRAAACTRLWNSADLVLQNLDKTYLADLETQGIPIVPTCFLTRSTDLKTELERTGWETFVIKPTVSAASFMTRRFGLQELTSAESFAAEILQSRGAMLQPYLTSVERGGEVSLVHIHGELTHCIFKEPRFSESEECVSSAFQPDAAQAAAAKRVIDTVKEPWLYARVDLMKSPAGDWLLSELELIEPTLFLIQYQPALLKFVDALGKVTAL